MSVQEYKNWCESAGMILPGNLTKLPNVLSSTRIALTWGDCGENHAGNQLVGEMQQTGTGVTMDDLRQIQADYDGIAELIEFTVPAGHDKFTSLDIFKK